MMRPLALCRAAYRQLGYDEDGRRLGDFTTPPRVLIVSAIAIGIGAIAAVIAWLLLKLIAIFTNAFFFLRFSSQDVDIPDTDLGIFILIVPVIGGLIVGIMARFGSERIRGHGIPEAIEAILINGSKVQPRVVLLKPISSAIAIGSGGPFGAEGPIIMTGGAIGSLVAQFIHLSSAERKTLLVAGAAAGMSATFATPVAAVILGIELLLFEWKPRSVIPVALASGVAALLRHYFIGDGPMFETPLHPSFYDPGTLLACVAVGLSAGVLSIVMTYAIYIVEDGFDRLPIHWMWWPAIGAVAIGIGGLIFPEALGVGYGNIEVLLSGEATMHLIVGIIVVKTIIWSVSLGSGTSGGVLAPLMMIGGSLGGLWAYVLPGEGPGFWPLVAMAAAFGGTMSAPLTAIVFTLELTHDVNALLPILIAVTVSWGLTVLVLRRSILTEKISRRGFHLGREYTVDPLEFMMVREAMRTNVVALPGAATVAEVGQRLAEEHGPGGQQLYPIIDADGILTGVISRRELQMLSANSNGAGLATPLTLGDIREPTPIVAHPRETLRIVASRMAHTGRTRLPVVAEDDSGRMIGMIALNDLLRARARSFDEERVREQVLRLRVFWPGRSVPERAASASSSDVVNV